MKKDLTATAIGMIVLTLVLGLLYPLAVTGVGQVVFNDAANGSQVKVDGRVVGSRLLGQGFRAAKYFHSRPSQSDYNPSATFFSNAGPNGADTRDAIKDNADAYLTTEGRYDTGLTRDQIPRTPSRPPPRASTRTSRSPTRASRRTGSPPCAACRSTASTS